MTNREKYKFDDFTFTNYRKLIQLAKAQGFEFILHKDDFKAERKDIICLLYTSPSPRDTR